MIGPRLSRLLLTIGVFVFALSLAGCGKTESENVVQVSGTAAYQGQPIPMGMIIFEPDSAKGNRGPQGYADIKDGKFDTRSSGKGVAAGPLIVRITGGDGVAPEAFSPLGKPLFAEQTTKVNVSRDAAVLTLDIPSAVSSR